MTELTLFDAEPSGSPFDRARRVRPDGAEYWSGRDLMPLMGYPRWNEFQTPLARAMRAAANQRLAANNLSGDPLKRLEVAPPRITNCRGLRPIWWR